MQNARATKGASVRYVTRRLVANDPDCESGSQQRVSRTLIDSFAAAVKLGLAFPPPEMPNLLGSPLEYSLFISDFQTAIEANETDNMRFMYLMQQCTDGTRKAIQMCQLLPGTNGYRRAKRILQATAAVNIKSLVHILTVCFLARQFQDQTR